MAHRNSRRLTVEQENAIDLLVTGVPDRAVAEQLGLARETVTRWRNGNPHFQAALNERRRSLWSEAQDRLRGLVGQAIDTLAEAAREGDTKAAVALLRAVNLYGAVPPPGGPTDPEAILLPEAEAWAQATERAEWEAKRKAAGLSDLEALLQDLQANGDGERQERVQELTRQRLAQLWADVEAREAGPVNEDAVES